MLVSSGAPREVVVDDSRNANHRIQYDTQFTPDYDEYCVEGKASSRTPRLDWKTVAAWVSVAFVFGGTMVGIGRYIILSDTRELLRVYTDATADLVAANTTDIELCKLRYADIADWRREINTTATGLLLSSQSCKDASANFAEYKRYSEIAVKDNYDRITRIENELRNIHRSTP